MSRFAVIDFTNIREYEKALLSGEITWTEEVTPDESSENSPQCDCPLCNETDNKSNGVLDDNSGVKSYTNTEVESDVNMDVKTEVKSDVELNDILRKSVKEQKENVRNFWVNYEIRIKEEIENLYKMSGIKEGNGPKRVREFISGFYPDIKISRTGYIWLSSAVSTFVIDLVIRAWMIADSVAKTSESTEEKNIILEPEHILEALNWIEIYENSLGKKMRIVWNNIVGPNYTKPTIKLFRHPLIKPWIEYIATAFFGHDIKRISLGTDHDGKSGEKLLLEQVRICVTSMLLRTTYYAKMCALQQSHADITHTHFMHIIKYELNWHNAPYIDVLVRCSKSVFDGKIEPVNSSSVVTETVSQSSADSTSSIDIETNVNMTRTVRKLNELRRSTRRRVKKNFDNYDTHFTKRKYSNKKRNPKRRAVVQEVDESNVAHKKKK